MPKQGGCYWKMLEPVGACIKTEGSRQARSKKIIGNKNNRIMKRMRRIRRFLWATAY